jgi:YebC/PmpR family DNA-binding regulatory protein
MAGHSHFKNIMRRKGAQDARKAKILTKITREIIVAAKGGPDPNFNAKLRAILVKARQAGMPKDKVDSAIAKGSGTGSSENYESVRYEGYGPGGVAVIVEALTDNRNRTAAEIRSIFTKNSGNLGETGSVGFMFERVGLIEYPVEHILEDAMLEAAIEAGAENCETAGDAHIVTTTMESLGPVRDALAKKFGDPASSKLAWIARTTAAVADPEPLLELIDALEDNDDVQDVFTNAEFDAVALQKLSA